MGMTYKEYYKIIDKKPSKKQLAEKAKVEKIYREKQEAIKLQEEKDKLSSNQLKILCQHCGSNGPLYFSTWNISKKYSGLYECSCDCHSTICYEFTARCLNCNRVIFYKRDSSYE